MSASIVTEPADDGERAGARIAELEAALAESRETIARLRESETWLRTLLEIAPDSITVILPDGTIVYSNRAADGGRLEDVVGASSFRYIVPDEIPRVRRALEAVAATGKPEVLEVTTTMKSVWEARIVRLPSNGASTPRLMSIGTEITERRRVQEAFRQSEERGRIAADSARMGLWSWESAEGVMTLDATSAAMLGWPREPTRTRFREFLAAIHRDDHTRIQEAARAFSARGVLQDFEFRVLVADGSVRWLLVSGKRATTGRPDSVQLVGSLFDVTERRRLEEHLRQAQKMEAIGELTAGIAHNFNNLLTAIIPNIQLARRHMGPVGVERLQDAEYAAGRAAELVRELMVFARRTKVTVKRPLDVRELVNRTVSMCRATFERALDIELVDTAPTSTVDGEGGQLEQVFLNICLNARDALDAAGRKERRISIELDVVAGEAERTPNDWLRIRFTDNGTGMSDEVRSRIFEPFFTTKEVGRGTGLGLATAYAIVTDHGGKLLCESTLGVGTTFSVLIPASRETIAENGVMRRRERGGTETVLVIDDERLVRNAVRGVLEPMGYTVREAPDAQSGLALFQRERERIDLILFDASMPGTGGETLFANVLVEAPTAKIVLFIGYRPQQMPVGAAGVLEKPFELEELLRVVRKVCDEPPVLASSGEP
jgi:PAS domain S-box-containing protein